MSRIGHRESWGDGIHESQSQAGKLDQGQLA